MANILHLDDLRKGLSGVLPSLGSFMCDCAIFSLASQGHSSGVNLEVETDTEKVSFTLTWEGHISLQMRRTMNDNERTTDYGAMGLAVLLVLQLTCYPHFVVSFKGTGVDFWLFEEEPIDEVVVLSSADALLEVSGIRKESRTNTMTIRHKLKIAQVKSSESSGLDTYIVITEFNKPKSLFVKNDKL
jgi:hypothetical protein